MHRRTSALLAELDRFHAELERAVSAVPAASRERPPSPGRWSVANVLEHLSIVEGRVVQGLARGFAAARPGLLPAADTPVVAAGDADRYLNRQRRIETTAASQPQLQLDARAAMSAVAQARAATRAFVLETDGLDLSSVVLPHPIFGPLNLYQWVVFIGGHEGRHTLQIQEIGEAVASVS